MEVPQSFLDAVNSPGDPSGSVIQIRQSDALPIRANVRFLRQLDVIGQCTAVDRLKILYRNQWLVATFAAHEQLSWLPGGEVAAFLDIPRKRDF